MDTFSELVKDCAGTEPISDDQANAFRLAAEPLIAWLASYGNPHAKVVVTNTGAELLAGVTTHRIDAFLKD